MVMMVTDVSIMSKDVAVTYDVAAIVEASICSAIVSVVYDVGVESTVAAGVEASIKAGFEAGVCIAVISVRDTRTVEFAQLAVS